MEPSEEVKKPYRYPESPPPERRRGRGKIVPRVLFPAQDSMSSGDDGGGGWNPPWKKGLATIGALILSWVFLKPLLGKLVSFIKEKYERH